MSALTGTGTLTRLILRRDRIRLPVWFLVASGLALATVSSVEGLYDTEPERLQYAESVGGNPASAVLNGPGYGLTTLGGINVSEVGALMFALIGLTSIFFVIRHTRAEEESGRAEMTGSAVVGRHAQLAAALLVATVMNLVIGAAVALSFLAYSLPAAGSIAFGLATAFVGLVFAAIAGVAAQTAEHARTARGLASVAFGVAFLLRALGDASAADGGSRLLSWLSPIGWAQQVRAFGGERWWVFGLLLAGFLATAWAAVALSARRDVGAGLMPARLGRAAAPPALSGVWGLAWRLQRGALIGWTVAVAVVAAVLGGVAGDIDDMVGGNADVTQVFAELGGSDVLVDSFLVWVLSITGLAAAAYGVSAVLRLRGEETEGHAESLLATAVPRSRLIASHVTIAALGVVVLMVTAGLVAGLVHGLNTSDVGTQVGRTLGGALVQIPAALLLAGIAVAVLGALPRLTVVAWLAVAVALVAGQLGGVLNLSQWALDVSPFTHLPKLPGGSFELTPVLWLSAITVALAVLGVARFRNRDVGVS